MAKKGAKIFLRPYKTRVDRCSTFCMMQYIMWMLLLFGVGGWFSYRYPIYETLKDEVSFASSCQSQLSMPIEVKDGINATADLVSRYTKNALNCRLCLRNRETIGFRGVLDLSLKLKLAKGAREELDLRDGRVSAVFTEILGSHCSVPEEACKNFEGYSDWAHFPSALNMNPFPAPVHGDSMSELLQNKPEYFAILSNSTKETLNLAVQGSNLLTSRMVSREFSSATSVVYGLLLSLETKMNTQFIEGVVAEKERNNSMFFNVTLGLDIAVFLITLITFVCGTFEHTDIKYKKWMPQSKGLLMMMVFHLFASHLFRHLFTLFGLDVAGGFLFASRLLELLIGCYHLYFWIDALFSEQVSSCVDPSLLELWETCW